MIEWIKRSLQKFRIARKIVIATEPTDSGPTKNGILIICAIMDRRKIMPVQIDYCEKYLDHKIKCGELTLDMVSHLAVLKSRKPV